MNKTDFIKKAVPFADGFEIDPDDGLILTPNGNYVGNIGIFEDKEKWPLLLTRAIEGVNRSSGHFVEQMIRRIIADGKQFMLKDFDSIDAAKESALTFVFEQEGDVIQREHGLDGVILKQEQKRINEGLKELKNTVGATQMNKNEELKNEIELHIKFHDSEMFRKTEPLLSQIMESIAAHTRQESAELAEAINTISEMLLVDAKDGYSAHPEMIKLATGFLTKHKEKQG